MVDVLTHGLWKPLGTEGNVYYQFTADGKLLTVSVAEYSVKDGVLTSDVLNGALDIGSDSAFVLRDGSDMSGYVLNRQGERVAPEEFVTPSPTPVPTPTPKVIVPLDPSSVTTLNLTGVNGKNTQVYEYPAQNLMDFADEMLKKYPDVDDKKFGVTGGSYGGFMTNWIIGHTDRFAAAASQRSIANWIAFEHTSDIGPSFTPNNQASTTRENVEKVWWHSPLKYADKCVTPTLFIHSDRDYRCWMVEALSMFTALKMHGCDARLCLFKEETHELSRSGKPRNRVRRMEEIVAWMDKYLK
jgi:hypothetical protein